MIYIQTTSSPRYFADADDVIGEGSLFLFLKKNKGEIYFLNLQTLNIGWYNEKKAGRVLEKIS